MAQSPEAETAAVNSQSEVTTPGATPGAWRVLRQLVAVEPSEVSAMVLACLYYFFLFSSYFILRPIRDAMAVTAGVSKLPWLWTGTLTAMLVCNPLFSALVARYPVKRFIAITYEFFALNLIAFYLLGRFATGANEVWLGRIFYVWTSVYNLFVNTVFWAFMADIFRSEQAKRLFGFIGVGGTLGAIVGSGSTAVLARRLGTTNLLLVSVALLQLAILIVVTFPKTQRQADDKPLKQVETESIGGSMWAGVSRLVQSPYLVGIAAFQVLYVLGSTVLYFEQTDIIGRLFSTRAERTEMLAKMEFAAQTLTALTQFFLTGRIIRWFGLPSALALTPAISALGFGVVGASALGITPLLITFIVFSVVRRGTNFALTNPSMEILYTVLSREDKYKTKSFIETFLYRAGDQVAAWSYAGLTALGLSLTGIAWASVPMSLVFLLLGVWLGRKESALATRASIPQGYLGAVASRAKPMD